MEDSSPRHSPGSPAVSRHSPGSPAMSLDDVLPLDASSGDEGSVEAGAEGPMPVPGGGALARPRDKVANYLTTHSFTAEPANEEDHTFAGIMFNVRCKSQLPVEYIELTHFWVRGDLGPVRVYSTPQTFVHKQERAEEWTTHFDSRLEPAYHNRAIVLDEPIRVKAGESCGVYIHSRLQTDTAIVYSEQRGEVTLSDLHMQILPGLAHVSCIPFHPTGPWGGWTSWRNGREFCGRMTYAVKYKLWSPEKGVHNQFPPSFRELVHTMMLCHRSREGRLNILPDDALYMILHFCSWDWASDEVEPEDSDQEEIRQRMYGHGESRDSRIRRWVRRIVQLVDFEEGEAEDDSDTSDADYIPSDFSEHEPESSSDDSMAPAQPRQDGQGGSGGDDDDDGGRGENMAQE